MNNKLILILSAAALAYFFLRKKGSSSSVPQVDLSKSSGGNNLIATNDRRLWLIDYVSRNDRTGEGTPIFRRMTDSEIDASYQYLTQYLMTGKKPLPGELLFDQIKEIGRKYSIFD